MKEPPTNQPTDINIIYIILYISLYFLYNINISGIGWLVGGSFMSETFLTINVTVWYS